MHIHRFEKLWLTFGIVMLIVFLLVLGVSAFAMGMKPPTNFCGDYQSVDSTRLSETAPFDNPQLRKIGDNEYEAVMTAFAFGYSPSQLEVPSGATVHFVITSKDVVHGFAIPGTNVNMMVIPGEVNQTDYTFTRPGEYLVLCNEYCGVAHELMQTKIIVK